MKTTKNTKKNAIIAQSSNYQYYILYVNGIPEIYPKVVIDSKFYKKYVNIMNKFEKLQKNLAKIFKDQK